METPRLKVLKSTTLAIGTVKLTYFMLARQSVGPVSLDSTSGPAAGFQDGDRVSGIFEESSRDESADAGADDDDV